MINVCYWGCFDCAADEINLITLDVFDYHNLFLGKEVKSQITGSLSQNALLK